MASASGGLPAGRKHFKVKKALKKMRERDEKEERELYGRKSRSKRFNNPDFDFGKKSLVYQINRGDFKDKIAKLVETKKTQLQQPQTEPRDRESRRTSFGRQSRQADDDRGPRSGFGRQTRRGQAEDDMQPRRRSPSSYENNRERPTAFDRMRQRAREELDEAEAEREEPDSRSSWGGRESFTAGRDRGFHAPATTLPYTTAASQFLFGRWPVLAALREARRKMYNLYIYAGASKRESIESIRNLAAKRGVRTTIVPEEKQHIMDNMSKGRPHNGLILEASPLPQLPITALGPVTNKGYTVDIARQLKEEADINGTEAFQPFDTRGPYKPFILLLHEVMDPGNLGAVLRTARFLGAAAVAVTKQTSSPVTPTVVKAAAGAAEEITIFSVPDPIAFLEASRDAGWASYVAVAPAGGRSGRKQLSAEAVAEQDPLREKPCILVLGNEGEGLSKRMMSRADEQVTIMRQAMLGTSSVDSLNVSVAAALLCDAFTRGARSTPKSFQELLKTDEKKALGGESVF